MTAPCYAARTTQGYWTCDVPGGCEDCRALAREANDLGIFDEERVQIEFFNPATGELRHHTTFPADPASRRRMAAYIMRWTKFGNNLARVTFPDGAVKNYPLPKKESK